MGAECSTETSVYAYRTTLFQNPEDNLDNYNDFKL
jgi:hypothetical protein